MKKVWDAEGYESSFRFVWNYGGDLLSLLAAKEGEHVLDVGCGTGHLTAKIAETGAKTHGIDAAPPMIAQARQNYPKLSFQLVDAAAFQSEQKYDAVFSNAALHWMHEADAVAAAIAKSLKPGGRFVAEMGGKGNIAAIDSAIQTSIHNYFPSVSQQSAVLERNGFEVTSMILFDRPTPLEGGLRGLRDWIAMFRGDNSRAIEEVEAELKPKLFHDGQWVADYRRLRFVAIRKLE